MTEESLGTNAPEAERHPALEGLTLLTNSNPDFVASMEHFNRLGPLNLAVKYTSERPYSHRLRRPIPLIEGETRYVPGMRFAHLVNQHRTGPFVTSEGLSMLLARADITEGNRFSAKLALEDVQRYGNDSLYQLTLLANIATRLRQAGIHTIPQLRAALIENNPFQSGLQQKGREQIQAELERFDLAVIRHELEIEEELSKTDDF